MLQLAHIQTFSNYRTKANLLIKNIYKLQNKCKIACIPPPELFNLATNAYQKK